MRIICDTRENRNMHILQGFNKAGIEWTAKKLNYGDYAVEGFENKVVIERKSSLTELSGNLCQQRIRFETELSKAKADGCKVVLLIEDEKVKQKIGLRIQMDKANIKMEDRQKKTWRTCFSGNSMYGSIKAMKERYDLDLIFCKKSNVADEIIKYFKEAIYENNNLQGNKGLIES